MVLILANGCSTYSKEDYGNSAVSNKESSCINMEPAQEMKCKEREKSLIIGLGADKNCNHPYEYEKTDVKVNRRNNKRRLINPLKKELAGISIA